MPTNDVKVQDNEGKSDELSSNTQKQVETSTGQSKPEASGSTHKVKSKRSTHKRHFPWITVFALVLVVLLGSANYWLYQQGEQLKQALARISQQQNNSEQVLSDLDAKISDTTRQQDSLSAQVQQSGQTQQSVVSSMDQISQQLKELATARGKDPLYWRVSEVEYLLTIANHRLILERDVQTAKIALQEADKRLRTIGDPGLITIREQIAREITQLEGVNMPDLAGMAAQLNSLIDSVDQLPFVKTVLTLDTQQAAETDREFTGFTNFVKAVWNDLVNGLFKVQRSDEAIEPLLPPEEKQFLLHNLGLKLEEARIALLRAETALFQKHLNDIAGWVQKYFDQDEASVATFLQVLESLRTVELKPALPDVSASLRALRNWLDLQKNALLQHGNYPVALLTEASVLS